MTADQREAAFGRALTEMMKKRRGWVMFTDAAHGDNYAEVSLNAGMDMRAEVSHRRWPASKLPALGPAALQRLDRLGFREAERNLARSYDGWSVARIAKSLEQVFREVYECAADFELAVQTGD